VDTSSTRTVVVFPWRKDTKFAVRLARGFII